MLAKRFILCLFAILSVFCSYAQDTTYIYAGEDDDYYMGNQRMTEDEYLHFIHYNCPEAWESYQKGSTLWKTGWGLFGAGGGCVVLGCLNVVMGGMFAWATAEGRSNGREGQSKGDMLIHGMYISGQTLIGLGVLSMHAAVPCLIVGKIKRNNSHEVYNEVCARPQPEITFGVQASSNGLGLAINF